MKNLATIQKIKSLSPIPGADRIEAARFHSVDWCAVVKKGDFSVDQLVVFIVPDTILPFNPWSDFLKDKKDPSRPIRLKSIRMKGQVSQGLVLSLKAIGDWSSDAVEGMDVSEKLGTVHYEKPVPVNMAGDVYGSFPTSLFPKTDELNILSYPGAIDELRGIPFYVSVKQDGCLDENTMIQTEDGIKTIKTICQDKYSGRVLARDLDTNKSVYTSILNHFIYRTNNDWYEIELENGKVLKLTGNHMIWLERLRCYRQVSQLTENDFLLSDK